MQPVDQGFEFAEKVLFGEDLVVEVIPVEGLVACLNASEGFYVYFCLSRAK